MSRANSVMNPQTFRIGDTVLVYLGSSRLRAKIVEDRGLIGKGGRRLFRVHLIRKSNHDETFEVPAEELTPVPR